MSGLRPRRRKLVQNVGLGKQRAGFTHVVLICDDVSSPPRFLHILLWNERLFPAATIEALLDTLPPKSCLWRRKSAWVTREMMLEILKELCGSCCAHSYEPGCIAAGHGRCSPLPLMFLRAARRKGIMVQ